MAALKQTVEKWRELNIRIVVRYCILAVNSKHLGVVRLLAIATVVCHQYFQIVRIQNKQFLT